MAQKFADLRRELAKRLNAWGGDISTGLAGTFTAAGTFNTAIDTHRPEDDGTWNDAWIVINPGSSDQVNSPTVWRQLQTDGGWVGGTTCQFLIDGNWPAPYTNGPPSGVTYELYKMFRPENWQSAINYALTAAYPERHMRIEFEIPQSTVTKRVDWGKLANNLKLSNPTFTIVPTANSSIVGTFQVGTYYFAASYYNDVGETLITPSQPVTITVVNSSVDIAAITGIPSGVVGVKYYCSNTPGSTVLSLLDIGSGALPTGTATTVQRGINQAGTVNQINFPYPTTGADVYPPLYNTTNVNIISLQNIQLRMNVDQFPEIWNDLPGNQWRSLGGTAIELLYFPTGVYNLRFVCMGTLPTVTAETDTTDEPEEMIYAGAEGFLWRLLVKTSTIVNVNWKQLADAANAEYMKLKEQYALTPSQDIIHTPHIQTIVNRDWGW